MRIVVIHLSDIHITQDSNPHIDNVDTICEAIQNHTKGVDDAFIVLTGDIAYSGKPLEYEMAKDYLSKIQKWISDYSGIKPHIIVVPGNHDCNFTEEAIKARELCIRDIQKNGDANIDDSVIKDCCEVQNPFFTFKETYNDEKTKFSDMLVWIKEYQIGKHKIVFNCYNTAWISEYKETPGTLHFPISRYPAELFLEKSNLSIGIFHHTLNWLSPSNFRAFSAHVEATSHIVFIGHEHVQGKSMKSNLEGTNTFFIDGKRLQNPENPNDSGFNLVIADLEEEKHKIYHYDFNGKIYAVKYEPDWISYQSKKSTNRIQFPINTEFTSRFLNNVGAQIKHRGKDDIILEDIYIFPDLIDLKAYKQSEKDFARNIMNSEVLFNVKRPSNKILITGPRNIGKTALCKILYSNYHDQGYIPIYVDGSLIKSASFDDFEKVVYYCYSEQYPKENIERFAQSNNCDKVIIIDDLDKPRFSVNTRATLIHSINQHYPNVLITGGNLLPVGEILTEEKQKEHGVEEYDQYGILELGHLLRSRFINNWYRIGNVQIEVKDLIEKHDEAQQIFNTIIGKNFVPAYPVFLLIILQTIEAGRPHDLEESSFGHYYQYLIYDSLEKVIHRSEEIDAYYNFLTDLAYSMFVKRIYEITKDDYYQFHSNYCKEYAIGASLKVVIDAGTLLNNLVDADILDDLDGLVKYKYPYIFYFFISNYFANNINNPSIRQMISDMCERLYEEEFADVIMFLTHHSKDPFILSKVLRNARSGFTDYQPMKFENDLDSVNSMLGELPKLVVEIKDIQQHREEMLKEKDIKEYLKAPDTFDVAQIPQTNEPLIALDLIAQLNVAFKLIEILGQIMKNYSGSLKGAEKYQLGEEAYMLGLRAINPFFEQVEKKKQNVVKHLRRMIGDDKKIKDEDIEGEARILLFSIFDTLSYGFIKTISNSVGSEHLSPTLNEILEKHDTIAVNLIDVSIKLDHFKQIPFNDMKRVKERVKKGLLPFSLLRQMARDYVYMFPTTYKERQQIYAITELSILEQMIIDQTSTQKKRLPPPKRD